MCVFGVCVSREGDDRFSLALEMGGLKGRVPTLYVPCPSPGSGSVGAREPPETKESGSGTGVDHRRLSNAT